MSVEVMRAAHVVVGGGVVGLAVARALARRHEQLSSLSLSSSTTTSLSSSSLLSSSSSSSSSSSYDVRTLVLEQHARIGAETSSRNSEVVHAGLYYPPTFLKTRLCVRGRAMLYDECARGGVAHRRCGKWIVAVADDECAFLDALATKARALGVPLHPVAAARVRRDEPQLRAHAVLESPETGIVDSHALMAHLHGALEHCGGMVATRSRVVAVEHRPCAADGAFRVHVEHVDDTDADTNTDTDGGGSGSGSDGGIVVDTPVLVNCAGLHASDVARTLLAAASHALPPSYHTHFCKGVYFGYAAPPLVSRLVYPTPEPNLRGLGTHATLDLAGHMRFGPDTEYVDASARHDHTVDARRRDAFAAAARRYLPSLDASALFADYAGVRPKLSADGEAPRDFLIADESARGMPGAVNLLGIESPGLTASLAIAEYVEQEVLRM